MLIVRSENPGPPAGVFYFGIAPIAPCIRFNRRAVPEQYREQMFTGMHVHFVIEDRSSSTSLYARWVLARRFRSVCLRP